MKTAFLEIAQNADSQSWNKVLSPATTQIKVPSSASVLLP